MISVSARGRVCRAVAEHLNTEPLSPADLAIAVVVSLLIFAAVEIEKLLRRRWW